MHRKCDSRRFVIWYADTLRQVL